MTDRPSDRAIAQAPNEDALIALFESVYEREWDRAAEESDDRKKAILGAADEHATRMAVRAVVAAAAPDGAQAVQPDLWRARISLSGYEMWTLWSKVLDIERGGYQTSSWLLADRMNRLDEYEVEFAYFAPPSQDAEDAARPHDVGTWLWTQLMDWCKAQHCAPATQDALFSIVERARKEFPSSSRQDSEDAALLRWCIRHSSWIRDDGRNYVSICVDRDADLSCIATTKAALEAARAARGGG